MSNQCQRRPPAVFLASMPELVGASSITGDEWSDSADLLELVRRRPAFHLDAACREAPLSVSWFIEQGGDARPAKAICARCLVVDECGAWAMAQGPELEGIWSGMSRTDRAIARRGLAA